jgi:hypothetical protein
VTPELPASTTDGNLPPAPSADSSNALLSLLSAVGIAGMLFMLCAVGWISARRKPPPPSSSPPVNIHEQMKAAMSENLNAHKQAIFDQIHPIGTAKHVVLHDFDLVSGSAGETHVVYRFTLYWEGPIEKDGFTKIQSTYDPESKRPVQTQLLATNGITHAEFQAAAFDLGWLIGQEVRAEQQRLNQQQAIQRGQGS